MEFKRTIDTYCWVCNYNCRQRFGCVACGRKLFLDGHFLCTEGYGPEGACSGDGVLKIFNMIDLSDDSVVWSIYADSHLLTWGVET
jgi:hypothetical protein